MVTTIVSFTCSEKYACTKIYWTSLVMTSIAVSGNSRVHHFSHPSGPGLGAAFPFFRRNLISAGVIFGGHDIRNGVVFALNFLAVGVHIHGLGTSSISPGTSTFP